MWNDINMGNIILTFLTVLASTLGITIKNIYQRYMDTKTKKEIVGATVQYVEQISKNDALTCDMKFSKAKEKSLEWLKEKGIKVSDTELEILIESAVNCYHGSNKSEKQE